MSTNRKRPHINDDNNNDEDGANNAAAAGGTSKRTMEERARSISISPTDLKELKITAHEAKVKMLEADLRCAKAEAKMREKSMEKKMEEIKQEVAQKMDKTAQEVAQAMAQKMDEDQKMAQKIEEIGQKNQQKFDEIEQQMGEIEQRYQQKFERIDRKMARLKDKLKLKRKINWNHMEPALLWDHLSKGKILINPTQNRWNEAKTSAATTLSENGLNAANTSINKWQFVYALKAFVIQEEIHHNNNRFPGTTIYYYEVQITTQLPPFADRSRSSRLFVGLSSRKIANDKMLGAAPNGYALSSGLSYCRISGKCHDFEGPKAEWKEEGDIIGCGIMLSPSPEKKLAIFFTFNGDLLGGKPIPISPARNCARLYPTVNIKNVSLVANFGDDLVANPFKFDCQKCRELVFE